MRPKIWRNAQNIAGSLSDSTFILISMENVEAIHSLLPICLTTVNIFPKVNGLHVNVSPQQPLTSTGSMGAGDRIIGRQ